MRVNNVGVWTDGATRVVFDARGVAAADQIIIRKDNLNGQFDFFYRSAAGALLTISSLAHAETGWVSVGITFSVAANQLIAYFNGVPVAAPMIGVVAWTTAFNLALIGAATIVPVNVWHGWLAHVSYFNYALTPAQMLDMGTI